MTDQITTIMVELGETKVKAEEGEERKYLAKFNKKKHGKNNNLVKCVDQDWDVPELLKGVEFSMAKNGPDLYLRALEKLQLYASTTYKNGADVWKSLKLGKVVTFTPPECLAYAERDVENLCKQHHQAQGATWSKSRGNVQGRHVHMWSSTEGPSM